MFGSVAGGADYDCKPPQVDAVTWYNAELGQRVFAHLLGLMSCDLTVTDEVARIMEFEGYKPQRPGWGSEPTKVRSRSGSLRSVWYLAERAAKLLPLTGFGLRRIAKRHV